MIEFKYDIVFGLVSWSITDAERGPDYFTVENIGRNKVRILKSPSMWNRIFKTQHKYRKYGQRGKKQDNLSV